MKWQPLAVGFSVFIFSSILLYKLAAVSVDNSPKQLTSAISALRSEISSALQNAESSRQRAELKSERAFEKLKTAVASSSEHEDELTKLLQDLQDKLDSLVPPKGSADSSAAAPSSITTKTPRPVIKHSRGPILDESDDGSSEPCWPRDVKPVTILPPEPRTDPKPTAESVADSKFKSWHDDDQVLFEQFFKNPLKLDGVYLEMGAFNGEMGSNSLFFDETLHWEGILVEANPIQFKKLVARRPHAWRLEMAACEKDPGQFVFVGGEGASGTDGAKTTMTTLFKDVFHSTSGEYNVTCVPLGKYLKKIGITHIDMFSLDVENSELITLDTLDWNIPIHVMLIEMNDLNMLRNDVIHSKMVYHGFRFVRKVGNMNELWVNDYYDDLMEHRNRFNLNKPRSSPNRPLHPNPMPACPRTP